MVILAAIAIGATAGWLRASALGGDTRDRVQYAVVYGLILAVATLFAGILWQRRG